MLPEVKHRNESGRLMHCSQGCDHVLAGRQWQLTALPSVRNVISCNLVHCTSSSSHAVLLKCLSAPRVKRFAHLCFFLHFTVIHLVFGCVTLYFFQHQKEINEYQYVL
jgi:hypothetical protein